MDDQWNSSKILTLSENSALLTQDWRNVVDAVAVHPGCRLEGFNQTYFRGSMQVWTGGEILTEDQTDKMRSARCSCDWSTNHASTEEPSHAEFGSFTENEEAGTFMIDYLEDVYNDLFRLNQYT